MAALAISPMASESAIPPSKLPTVLVTGASRGIGSAIVRHLLALGANVVATSRSDPPSAVEWQSADVTALTGRVVFVKGDITDASTVADVIRTAKREFGRIDAVVNNAA